LLKSKGLWKQSPWTTRKVADWLQHYLDEKWDAQIDIDIDAGRLDKLADQAIEDHRAGRVKPMDEVSDQP
jgi:hypothetical protein